MKKSLCFCTLIALLLVINLSNATVDPQDRAVPPPSSPNQSLTLKPYAFIGVRTPVGTVETNNHYRVYCARLGVDFNSQTILSGVNFGGLADIDAANSNNLPVFLFGRLSKEFKTVDLTATLIVGKIPSPIALLYPSALTMETNRRPLVNANYPLALDGASLWLKKGDLTIRFAHFNSESNTGAITWQSVSVFYQSRVGYGFLYQKPRPLEARWQEPFFWLNPFVGTSIEADTVKVFVNNHINLPWGLSLHGQIDTILPEEGGIKIENASRYSGFAVWEFAKNSRIKAGYDGVYDSAILEFTVYFYLEKMF